MSPDSATPTDAVRDAARRQLQLPLAALRAALEELGEALEADVERRAFLTRALGELERADRSAEALADYAVPRDLQPLSCSLREVALGAHGLVSTGQRERVRLVDQSDAVRLVVDGPLFSRGLARLLEEVLAHGEGEVLFHPHHEGDTAFFSIV